MFRWTDVDEITLDEKIYKMYRPMFKAEVTQEVPVENTELDHYAYKYLGSELFMYKILDLNFVNYMENRGDMKRMTSITIPVRETLT